MGFQTGMQLGVFTVTAMLMAKLGTSSLAAHEIALQTLNIVLPIPMAFSAATTVRVGQIMGEKNTELLFRAAFVNLAFIIFFGLVVAPGFELFASSIAAIYLDIDNPDNAVAIIQAILFIKLAGVFQVFHSIRCICVGSLLGLQDTKVIMLINILSGCGVGLGGGYLMGMTLGWGGTGLWYGLIMAPVIASLILGVRFYLKVKKIGEDLRGESGQTPDPTLSS